MKKRILASVLVAIMIIAALSACGNKADEGNKPAENTDKSVSAGNDETPAGSAEETKNVTITLGIWPEDTLTDDIAVHEGYVATMKELHPEVTCVPAYYKYATDTFMSMVEAGTVPTVFETWFTEPQKLIREGAVADITDELEARGWLDLMSDSVRDLLSDENGRVYGVPRDAYALGVMANVELFREAGLVDGDGYPIFPKTWDELAETAKTIKDKTGAAGLCLLAKDNAGGWHFSNIAWCFGASPLCIDNGDGTFTSNLDSPEAIAAMEYVKSLKWDYDVLTADPTNEDWGTGFMQIGTGACAMYIGANDAVAQPTQVNGLPLEDLGMFAIPAGPGGQYSLSGGTPYMFSANATPEEINAALDYLEIMGKSPMATDASIEGMRADAQNRVDNGIPVIQSFPCWKSGDKITAEKDIISEFSNVDAKLYDSYFASTASAGLHAEEPGETQAMYEELTRVLQEVITNKDADVAALMKQADEGYQKTLDTFFPAK